MLNVQPSDLSVEQPQQQFLDLVRSVVLEEQTPTSPRWLLNVRRTLGRPVVHTYLSLWVLLSPRIWMHGFLVALLDDWEDRDAAFNKIRDSLQLISNTDHSRLVRIRRDIRRILVLKATEDAAAAFIRGTATCFLSPDLLRESSVLSLAQTVVHEAMHARLRRLRRGLSRTSRNRAREEALALRGEIAFTRKVPGEEAANRLRVLWQLYRAYRWVARELSDTSPAA
jgi:hypothetical protein